MVAAFRLSERLIMRETSGSAVVGVSAAAARSTALTEGWALAVIFAVLLFAAAAPILSTPVAPLADYVNHLARMRVLADIGGDAGLAEAFRVNWAIIPNLMMDLLVPALTRLLGVYPAGQLFLIVAAALPVSGAMVLNRALFGRWSPWPLIVFPFIYNGVFLFGLVNYLFGVGLAVWGAAAWIALTDKPLWRRAAFSALLVPCLFFCHLFAVGLYGLAIFSVEVARLAERGFPRREVLKTAAALALPFAPTPFLLASSPTMGLAKENIWESVGKIDGLVMALQAYSDLPDMAVIALCVGGVVWLARRGVLTLHPAGLTLAGVLLLVYLAMPRMLFGSWLADQRLPAAALFLLAGFARFSPRFGTERNLLLALILGASVVRFADVEVHWRTLDQEVTEFRESAALIAPGARVLVAYADHAAADYAVDAAISHAPCVATIERGAVVSTLFTVPGKQILDLQPAYRGLVDAEDGQPPTASQLLATVEDSVPGAPRFWDAWPQRYDYLYILYTEAGEANPDPDHLTPLAEGRRFRLYAVRPEPLQEETDL
jgi:hypothetical protein